MTLSKSVIVQANATIIAGILILLTIQSVTLQEIVYETEFLTHRLQGLQDFKANLVAELGDISETRLGQLLNEKIFEAELAVVDLTAKLKATAASPQDYFNDPKYLVGILILPFAAALILELFDGIRNPKKSECNKLAVSFMIAGLIYLGYFIGIRNIFSI